MLMRCSDGAEEFVARAEHRDRFVSLVRLLEVERYDDCVDEREVWGGVFDGSSLGSETEVTKTEVPCPEFVLRCGC